MSEQNTLNVLGNEKIGKLLLQYSLPAIVATTVASLYNIIDRIFIGQGVGPLAISGLALTFPLMNLSAAFGSLVGIGASAMVSIKLGEKDRNNAIHILGNALALNILIGITFTLIMLLFLDQILIMFGASKDTLPYAKDFMYIILSGNVFTHIYLGLNSIMRASGYPKESMITTLLTVCINLILAPIFIFKFKWGLKGAAAATVFAQFFGTVWVIIHFLNKNHYVHFMKGYFKPKFKIIRDIFSIGVSNFIMFVCSSLVVMFGNIMLAKYGGDYAIGAFGIIFSLQSLFVMIVLGFNQGMQPIAGYNFGARKFQRVKQVFIKTIIAGTCVSSAGFLLSELFSHFIVSLFTNDSKLIEVTAKGMRLIFAMFPLVGFQMVTTSFFQSIGHARISIILSLYRQIIFLIPALMLLPRLLSLNGVWLSVPTADTLSSALTFFILRWQIKKIENRFLE
jgi:putative MATE family efflux protein